MATVRVYPPTGFSDYGAYEMPPETSGGGGGSIATQEAGVLLDAAATTLNFVGAGQTAVNAGSHVTQLTVPGAGEAGGQFNWGLFIAGRHVWPAG